MPYHFTIYAFKAKLSLFFEIIFNFFLILIQFPNTFKHNFA